MTTTIARAVSEIENVVVASHKAVTKYVDGDVDDILIRVELEGIWRAIKLIASALDADEVSVGHTLDWPTGSEIEAIVRTAADGVAARVEQRAEAADGAPKKRRRRD